MKRSTWYLLIGIAFLVLATGLAGAVRAGLPPGTAGNALVTALLVTAMLAGACAALGGSNLAHEEQMRGWLRDHRQTPPTRRPI